MDYKFQTELDRRLLSRRKLLSLNFLSKLIWKRNDFNEFISNMTFSLWIPQSILFELFRYVFARREVMDINLQVVCFVCFLKREFPLCLPLWSEDMLLNIVGQIKLKSTPKGCLVWTKIVRRGLSLPFPFGASSCGTILAKDVHYSTHKWAFQTHNFGTNAKQQWCILQKRPVGNFFNKGPVRKTQKRPVGVPKVPPGPT